MELEKKYRGVDFNVETVRTVVADLRNLFGAKLTLGGLSVRRGAEAWKYDDLEDFAADIQKGPCDFSLYAEAATDFTMWIHFHGPGLYSATLRVVSSERTVIQRIANVLSECASRHTFSPPPPPTPKAVLPKVFIGHGGSPQWRDLKDHLHELHHFRVDAYETGARAGHEIRDVLEGMLESSSFAILVMTGEDEQVDGTLRARQNVVHELGLFQGRLGFTKAIVLLEEGTQEFSNINGVTQIRYSRGRVKETFGEVVATLKRELR